jgi:hypothetical protein
MALAGPDGIIREERNVCMTTAGGEFLITFRISSILLFYLLLKSKEEEKESGVFFLYIHCSYIPSIKSVGNKHCLF